MIVAIAGIDGNVAAIRHLGRCQRIAVRAIIHRQNDNALHIRPQHFRVGAALSRLDHPVHAAMVARADEACEVCREPLGRIGRSEARERKAETDRLGLDERFQLVVCIRHDRTLPVPLASREIRNRDRHNARRSDAARAHVR